MLVYCFWQNLQIQFNNLHLRRFYQLKRLDEIHYKLIQEQGLRSKTINPANPPKQQVNQAQQTRNVRFDKRRPQTLELRRCSSKFGYADFQGIEFDQQLL